MTTLTRPVQVDQVRFPDGSTITFRPTAISDGRLISNFVGQLSAESEYRRLLSSAGGARSQWVANLINADQRDSLVYGAVAVNQFGSSLVAIAESIRDPGDIQRAEFALAATDQWQNLGIGTLLTRHVARIARSTGVRFWETCMVPDNTQMARVINKVGKRVSYTIEHGLAHVVHEITID